MLKKSLLLLPILSLFLIACQHIELEEYGCPYGEKSECNKCSKKSCDKCSKQACGKCKNAEKGKLCSKCSKKSCDKKRKSKDAVGLIFPVNNSKVRGWLQFQSTEGKKVVVKAEVSGLAPNQKHGFHIHQYGDCRENGKNAGTHFNPYKAKHGAPHHKEKHLGDLGNLKANKDGLAFYQKTMKICVKKLIGRSVIVHAGTDDLKSQPSGNSGAYIGCGVIGRLPKRETSKTLPPVKIVSDKKEDKKTEDSKLAVKNPSDKKEDKKTEDSKPTVKNPSDKKEDKKTEDSKPTVKTPNDKKEDSKPTVKTPSDKKEDSKPTVKKPSDKKEDKKTEDSKPTVKTPSDKKEAALDSLYDELDKVLWSNDDNKKNKINALRMKIKLVKNDSML